MDEEIAKLEEAVREVEEHPERLITFDEKAFREKYGLPERVEYPLEREYKNRVMDAVSAYDRYCAAAELQKIKDQLAG